jgi:hypothetical protein
MGINFDPQANGWIDDDTEAGSLRAKIVSSDLVRVPFRAGQYVANATAQVATYYYGEGIAASTRASSGIHVLITKNYVAGVAITHNFYGRKYGLRFVKYFGPQYDFGVMIDGVAYQVSNKNTYISNANAVSYGDGENLALIADDLPDGRHEATIVCVCCNTATDSQWFFSGYLAEARAGYVQPPERLMAMVPLVVPATLTNIPSLRPTALRIQALSAADAFSYFRKIIYTNVSANPALVTIRRGNAVAWQKTIAAADSAEFDPGGPVLYDASQAYTDAHAWSHISSVESALNFTIIGGA